MKITHLEKINAFVAKLFDKGIYTSTYKKFLTRRNVLIGAGIISVAILIAGTFQVRKVIIRHELVQTMNSYAAFVEQVEKVDEEADDFRYFSDINEYNYKSTTSKLGNEYEEYVREYNKLRELNSELQTHIEKAPTKDSERMYRLMSEVNQQTMEEFALVNEVAAATHQYFGFISRMYSSEALNDNFTETEDPAQMIAQLDAGISELTALRNDLKKMSNTRHFEEIQETMDGFLSKMITFFTELKGAIETEDIDRLFTAVENFEEDMAGFDESSFSFASLEKIAIDSEKRVDSINELSEKAVEEQEKLSEIYDIELLETDSPARIKQNSFEDSGSYKNSTETDLGVEAYEL